MTPAPFLTVRRWVRYGHDRLYVATLDGTKVAWQDQRTGQVTVEQPQWREQALAALAAHSTADQVASSTPIAAPTAAPPTIPLPPQRRPAPIAEPAYAVTATPIGTDLALNRPGARLLVEAADLRAQHPVRYGLARLLGVHTDERAKRVGGKGEKVVGERLERLPAGWRVLHGIVRRETGTDSDHLVIGPAGVFTVNTKWHAGKRVWVGGDHVRVGGGRPHYVREARSEARIVARTLTDAAAFPVQVRGLVAVIAADLAVTEQPADVHVLARRALPRWLLKQPTDRLSPEQVEALYAVARRSTTWLRGT